TRLPLAGAVPLHQVQYGLPPARRAHHFPVATSSSISICSSRSATIRFSRWFSPRSGFSSLASSAFMPPYWFRQRCSVASLISRALATAATSWPCPASWSTSRSLRMICSASVFCLSRELLLGPLGPPKSLTGTGSLHGGQDTLPC